MSEESGVNERWGGLAGWLVSGELLRKEGVLEGVKESELYSMLGI